MTVSSATNKSGPYSGNGVTTVFAYGFRILDATHIQVVTTTGGTDTIVSASAYSVSGVGNTSGGNVTFTTAPATGTTINLIRNAPFTQGVDLENQGAYYAETVEEAFDLAAMRDQQLQEQISRSVKIPVGEDASTLDTLAERIIRLDASADNIDTVAGIAGNVTTVAGISGNVTTVSGISGDVTAVAGVAASVPTVAAIDANVTTVAGISLNVTAVASIAPNVTTVAGISAGVTTVAGIAPNVTTVAGISADVTSVAGVSASVPTVAGVSADVTTVAGIAPNVTAVAGVAPNVTTVAGISANVTTVAGIAPNVTTVAGVAADVPTVAGISADVTTVAGIAPNVTAVAGVAAEVPTVAGISANVTTVAGISANVTTVAGISADVTFVAANVADVTNFADVYLGPKAANPTLRNDGSVLQTGDLFFSTEVGQVRVYNGTAWIAASSSINGTSRRQSFTATAGQTVFPITDGYDPQFADVYLNGVKLVNGVDVDVSSGSAVVLTVAATAGDAVDVVAYGAFELGVPQVIRTPVISAPTPNQTGVLTSPTVEGSPYAPAFSIDARAYRLFEIDLAAGDFSSPVVSEQVNADSFTPATPLATSTEFKVRIKDVAVNGGQSGFSAVVPFTTTNISVNAPTLTVEGFPTSVPETPTLTTGAFATTPTGQDTHASTSWIVRLAADDTIVYQSLADTVNLLSIVVPAGNLLVNTSYKFQAQHVGTTYGASAVTEVTATTVGSFGPTVFGQAFGGGFYTGNIVEGGTEYYIIVAPKASGESSTVQFKTSQTASPTATQTLNNGPAATAAMVSAGSHPAADFCAGLTIGGFSDWYMPARDELELCFRNLKPTTDTNNITDRPKSSIAYPEGDDLLADTMGVNRNSSPAGTAYTSGNPVQTSATAFQAGGTEAFGSAYYWCSSEFSDTSAWRQLQSAGVQLSRNKDDTSPVRAIRRVAV